MHLVVTGFSFAATVFASAWWTVQYLLYPSLLQLSPSQVLVSFPSSFSASASVVSAVLPSLFCFKLDFAAAAPCLMSSSGS